MMQESKPAHGLSKEIVGVIDDINELTPSRAELRQYNDLIAGLARQLAEWHVTFTLRLPREEKS